MFSPWLGIKHIIGFSPFGYMMVTKWFFFNWRHFNNSKSLGSETLWLKIYLHSEFHHIRLTCLAGTALLSGNRLGPKRFILKQDLDWFFPSNVLLNLTPCYYSKNSYMLINKTEVFMFRIPHFLTNFNV